MGNEMSKASVRRAKDWRYANRWLRGTGLDIGCGYDVLPGCVGYDHLHGHKDAQTLPEIADSTYDFVVSSHCLEHVTSPEIAMTNWLRVVKPGGFTVVTVPDWDLYEHRHWPSKFNVHQTSWTTRCSDGAGYPSHVIHVPSWLNKFAVDVEMIQLLTEYYDWDKPNTFDQTGSAAECAIEFILKKN